MRRAMETPKPLPASSLPAARRNRSPSRGNTSGATPGPWSSIEISEGEKARPDYLVYRNRKSEAVPYLEKALKAPPRPGREVADEGRREEVRTLLKAAR